MNPNMFRVPVFCAAFSALYAVGALGLHPAFASPPGLKRVHVKDVVLDPRNKQPIVLLEERGKGFLLPIWIGQAEARAILMELKKVSPPRPMTHDLMRNIIGSLKGKVQRVVVTELKSGTFYAFIVMKNSGRSFSLDSRPSDAIALALRVKAPIFVKPAVMKAGIRHEPEPEYTHRKRLGLVLQKLTPALARYFGGGVKKGLLVSQLENGAAAAQAGLRRGDVIYQVGGKTVDTVELFEQVYVNHRGSLRISVRRGPEGKLIQVRISR